MYHATRNIRNVAEVLDQGFKISQNQGRNLLLGDGLYVSRDISKTQEYGEVASILTNHDLHQNIMFRCASNCSSILGRLWGWPRWTTHLEQPGRWVLHLDTLLASFAALDKIWLSLSSLSSAPPGSPQRQAWAVAKRRPVLSPQLRYNSLIDVIEDENVLGENTGHCLWLWTAWPCDSVQSAWPFWNWGQLG